MAGHAFKSITKGSIQPRFGTPDVIPCESHTTVGLRMGSTTQPHVFGWEIKPELARKSSIMFAKAGLPITVFNSTTLEPDSLQLRSISADPSGPKTVLTGVY